MKPLDYPWMSTSLTRLVFFWPLPSMSASYTTFCTEMNSSKMNTLLSSRSCTEVPPHPSLFIGNTSLAESEYLTILGVTFDSHLTFQQHLMNVSTNAARKPGIVHKASYIYNNENTNLTCFRSFVLPLLEYCSSV